MGVGTQAPIGHEHVPWLYAWMDRLHPGEIVDEKRRDDQLQEHTSARMEQPDLAAHREDGVGWQQRGPLVCEALQDGDHTRHHRVTSCAMRVLTPIHTGEVWRIPTSVGPSEIDHGFCLT